MRWINIFLRLLLVFTAVSFGPVRADVSIPPLTARIIDLTGTLAPDQIDQLNRKSHALEDRRGSQIVVLVLPTTGAESIEEYGIRLAQQWKIGRKNIDDGAILIVAKDDHRVRLEVGYGLEGALNDATCKRIIDELITPRFRERDYFAGISNAIDQMVRVIEGESLPPTKSDNGLLDSEALTHWALTLLLFCPGAMLLGLFAALIPSKKIGQVSGPVVAGSLLSMVGIFLIHSLVATLVLAPIGAGLIYLFISRANIETRSSTRKRRVRSYSGSSRSDDSSSDSSSSRSDDDDSGISGGGGSFGGGGSSGSW